MKLRFLSFSFALMAFAGLPHAASASAVGAQPKEYNVTLQPDLSSGKIFGHEIITLSSDMTARDILLDAADLHVSSVSLDGERPSRVEQSQAKQSLRLVFTKPILPGQHKLEISYVAMLQQTPQGLFRQDYIDFSRQTHSMVATQMEPMDARRMFPCFDRPDLKARFRISIIVPKAWTALSNMPVGHIAAIGSLTKRIDFLPTPPMSTYLVAIAAGEFSRIGGSAGNISTSLYAPGDRAEWGAFALDAVNRLLPYYEKYYGIAYPLPKLDSIAIPGGFSGGMENWGAITYNEDLLLLEPGARSASAERGVFSLVAHEVSHQWTGDLITMHWWNDLWLNEGFATWMETKAADAFHPEWHMWLTFDREMNSAMFDDALVDSQAIDAPVLGRMRANDSFNDIAYTKAGAVLRMLEDYLGPKVFQKGVQRYIRSHQFGNATVDDLWAALSAASGKDVAHIAGPWVEQAGFPLLTVRQKCESGVRVLFVTQERYYEDQSKHSGASWPVPFDLALDARKPVATHEILHGRSAQFAGGDCSAPVILNAGSVGFFRVDYDPSLLALITQHFMELPDADRLTVLQDVRDMASSGRIPLAKYLELVAAEKRDTDPQVQSQIVRDLAALRLIPGTQDAQAEYDQFLVGYLRPVVLSLGGWDGPADEETIAVRNAAIAMLAEAGDAETIQEAHRRFDVLAHDHNAYTPDMRSLVLAIVGAYADQSTYVRLEQLALGAGSFQRAQLYVAAMLDVRDEDLARQSLFLSLQLPSQYSGYRANVIATVAKRHPSLAWNFLRDHTEAVFGHLSEFDRATRLASATVGFAGKVPQSELAAFLRDQLPAGHADLLHHSLERIRIVDGQVHTLQQQLATFTGTN